MRVTGDEYGTFGVGAFKPAEDTRFLNWQYFGSLMLTDGTDYAWLGDEEVWGNFAQPSLRNLLPDEELEFDTLEAAKRTSQFYVSGLRDLVIVDLVQEIPEDGYNFVQTYTFTKL